MLTCAPKLRALISIHERALGLNSKLFDYGVDFYTNLEYFSHVFEELFF